MDMRTMIPESHPLHRLFRGLTESTFMNELGIGDPSLVGYVAELLASFVPSQAVWRLRDKQGRPLFQVTADGRRGRSGRGRPARGASAIATSAITPCSGPASTPRPWASFRGRCSADCLINYQQQGKRSYYVASTLSAGGDRGCVFRRLSDQFELCAFGLSRVRREWEKIEAEGRRLRPDPIRSDGEPDRNLPRIRCADCPRLRQARAGKAAEDVSFFGNGAVQWMRPGIVRASTGELPGSVRSVLAL